MIFELIKSAPLDKVMRSRDGCIYMRRGMKAVGWIPPQEGWKRYLYFLWASVPFIFGAVYLPFGLLMTYIVDIKNFTPGEFLVSLQVAISAVGACIKSHTVLFFLWRLRDTEILLDTMDKRVNGEVERRKIHIMVAACNLVFLLYATCYFSYTFIAFLSNALTGHLPWFVYNPLIDWQQNLLYFWIESIFEYIIVNFSALLELLSDTYLVVYLIIIRAHFDLLKNRVRELRRDPILSEDENYEELVQCIIDHKNIVRCCQILKPIISITIFVQFLLCGSVLGLTLISIFFFSNLWRGISTTVFLVAVLIQTFPFCYLCQLLINDCEEVSDAIAQSNWIDAEEMYKATLRIFLHHAQQPITFVAGGIIPVTVRSNFNVAKFAFSVITIARQMNLADRFKKE